MTEQTGDVLADIDAALEGWHGRDAISPDAMRWAPEPPPPLVRRRMDDPSPLTPEEIERLQAELRQFGQSLAAGLRASFGPDSEFAERFKVFAKAIQALAKAVDPVLPPELHAPKANLRTPALDERRTHALEALHRRGTGPRPPRLDGRR